MAAFTPKQYEAQLKRFMGTELQSLEDAAGVSIFAVGTKLVSEQRKELRKVFRKTGHQGNAGFMKAVKAHNLKPRGGLGHASFVRMGVPFMGIFQEGGTIAPGKFMIVRLPGGEALGLPRITKTNKFSTVLSRLAAKPGVKGVWKVPKPNGAVYYARLSDRVVPIYALRQQVNLRKHIHFYEKAEALAKEIPKNIQRLVGGP